MICDNCGTEAFILTLLPGVGWVCKNTCAPPSRLRGNALFASVPEKANIHKRGFKKSKYNAIRSRQLDDYGNVYENGKLIEEHSHDTCLKMDRRVRERVYALKHRQPDPSAGWHRTNPDLDRKIE